MLNLFLSESTETASKGQQGSWWIYVVLIVMVVVMLVLPMVTNKKKMKEYNQMLDQLRVGDKVRTIGGVVGRVTKISTKGDIKTFILETGSKGSKTTMEFDMAAVGTVLESTYVAPVEQKEEKKEVVADQTEEKEEVKDEPAVEETVEEKAEATEKTEINEDVVLAKKKTSKKSKK